MNRLQQNEGEHFEFQITLNSFDSDSVFTLDASTWEWSEVIRSENNCSLLGNSEKEIERPKNWVDRWVSYARFELLWNVRPGRGSLIRKAI